MFRSRVSFVVVVSLLLGLVPNIWVIRIAGALEAGAGAAAAAESEDWEPTSSKAAKLPEEAYAPRPSSGVRAPLPESGRRAVGDEVAELRTAHSKTFVAPDGLLRSEVSTGPLHFRGANGGWREYDSRWTREAGGWAVAADRVTTRVAASASASSLVSVQVGSGRSAGYGLVGARPVAGVAEPSGAVVRYPAVLDGVDVELAAVAGGVKETLVIAGPSSPRVFDYSLTLEGLAAQLQSDGGLALRDSEGVTQLVIPPGWMMDSAGGADDGVISGGVTYELLDGGQTLRLRLDDGWLDDPARVWPVRVDPTLVSNAVTTQDTWVDQYSDAGDAGSDGSLRVGPFDMSTNPDSVRRAFMKFPDLLGLQASEVVSADLRLYNWSSRTCSPRDTKVRRVTEAWPTGPNGNPIAMTWTNQPGVDGNVTAASASESHGNTSGTPTCANAAITYQSSNLTQIVKNWLSTPTSNYGLRVSTPSSTDTSEYKTFASFNNTVNDDHRPRLVITHTNRTPTVARTAPGHGLRFNYNPTLKAEYNDPDGLNGTVTFRLYEPHAAIETPARNPQTGAAIPPVVVNNVASGATASATFPNLPDGWYEWTAEASDGVVTSDPTSKGLFEKSDTGSGGTMLGFADWFQFQEVKLNDRTTLGVNVANGNLVLRTNDLQVKGAGIDTDFTRVYNSQQLHRREMGYGWTLGPGRHVGIYQTSAGSSYFEDASGSRRFFKWENGDYTPPKGTDAELTRQTDNAGVITGYELTYRDQTKYTFVGGTLDKITDRWGHVYAINNNLAKWNAVADTRDRDFHMMYEAGRTDQSDRDLITGVWDVQLDKRGRTRRTTYAYNDADQLTSFTDLEGNVTVYDYYPDSSTATGQLKTIRQCGTVGCPSSGDPVGGTTTITYWDATSAMPGWVKTISQSMTDPVTNQTVTRTTSFDYEPTADDSSGNHIVRTTVNDAREAEEQEPDKHKWVYETERARDVYPATGNGVTYDERNGRLSKWTDPKGHSRGSQVNPTTNVETYTDAAGEVVTATFDGTNHLKQLAAPGESPAKLEYGKLTDPSDPAQHSPTKLTSPQGTTTSFGYHADSGALSDLKDASNTQLWKIDYIENPTDPTDPQHGQPWKITDPNGKVTVFSYDLDGNRNGIDYPGTPDDGELGSVTQTWDALSRPDELTDGNNTVLPAADRKTTVFDFDRMDRITSVTFGVTPTDLDGILEITYEYDALGNKIKRTDNGVLTTFKYDAWQRLRNEKRVADWGKTYTYNYDAVDNLTLIDDGNGFGDDDIEYAYDAANLLSTLTEPPASGNTNLITRFGYDRRNNRTCTSYPNDVEQRSTYTNAGQLDTILAGKLTDDDNWCDDEDNDGTTDVAYAVDKDIDFTGMMGTASTLPMGLSTLLTRFGYSYEKPGNDDDGDNLTVTTTPNDSADENKTDRLRYAVTDIADEQTAYTYDDRDRLTKAVTKTQGGSGSQVAYYEYGYDKASNRTTERTGSSTGPLTTFVYRASNAVCWKASGSVTNPACGAPPSGATTYVHDANGNLTAGAGLALGYNSANQTCWTKPASTPSSATCDAPPTGATSYTYAGPTQDERLSAGAWTYTDTILGTSLARDGGTTQMFTRDESGTLTGMRTKSEPNSRGSNSYHYLSDGLGSIVAVTNATGGLEPLNGVKTDGTAGSAGTRYKYDPYGTTTVTGATSTTGLDNPWRYTGQHQDPTGLYKMGARYLSPGSAQWTQPDPSNQEANPYLCVNANPINLTDPTGRLSGWDCLFAGIAVTVILAALAVVMAIEAASIGLATPVAIPVAATLIGAAFEIGVATACALNVDD